MYIIIKCIKWTSESERSNIVSPFHLVIWRECMPGTWTARYYLPIYTYNTLYIILFGYHPLATASAHVATSTPQTLPVCSNNMSSCSWARARVNKQLFARLMCNYEFLFFIVYVNSVSSLVKIFSIISRIPKHSKFLQAILGLKISMSQHWKYRPGG